MAGSLIIKVQQSEISTCQSFIVSAGSLPLTVSKLKLTQFQKIQMKQYYCYTHDCMYLGDIGKGSGDVCMEETRRRTWMLFLMIFHPIICKVAVPEGCEYVPLVQKAKKQAKVSYMYSSSA